MKKFGIGGANTQTGIHFEAKTDLLVYLDENVEGYSVKKVGIGSEIFFENELVAKSFRKHELYKYLASKNIDWTKYLSSQLLPDDAIYVIKNNTVFIIEKKYQQVGGSVDEKLQTSGFKLRQYKKLFSELKYDVKYIYVLSDWFKNKKYKDVLEHIESVDCKHYFEYLPLDEIGLPLPSEKK